MSEVIVIRPGRTDYDDQNRIQGRLDLPLNERGRDQVRRLGERLRDRGISVVYSSPGNPALETAERLSKSLDARLRVLDDLQNLDQGLWQGLELCEIRRMFGKVYRQWKDDPGSVCPPRGEPVEEAVDRVRRGLTKPLRRSQPFAVVAAEPLASIVLGIVSGQPCPLPMSSCKIEDDVLAHAVETVSDANSNAAGEIETICLDVATSGTHTNGG